MLAEIARAHDATKEAVALAFAIPKASTIAHVEANARRNAFVLDASDIDAIDATYPVRERVGSLPMN